MRLSYVGRTLSMWRELKELRFSGFSGPLSEREEQTACGRVYRSPCWRTSRATTRRSVTEIGVLVAQ